ncbi:MAG TPA: FapA family protein [Tepidisphaeraceae bacterium]|nr:FapA family protein [Tepidisphaeraceae bacterium]
MPVNPCIPAPCVVIGEDGLSVTLKVSHSDAEASRPTPANLLSYLAGLGVTVADPKVIERLAGRDGRIKIEKDIVLVQGRRPVPERPGRVEMLVHAGQVNEAIDGPPVNPNTSVVSHYERASYAAAVAGQAIATITPVTPGVDGRDVFGAPIPHARVRTPVELGRNVELDPDGVTVRATAPGRVCHAARTLWVETTVKIAGDVNFGCGNIDVAGDVLVGGSVLDMFKVRGANIRVNGAIEAAEVTATENLLVAGGILGKGKGRCQAGGDVACKYASNATLIAGGDIKVRGEISHTRIIARGRLAAETAALTSGHITANGGITCRSLGSVIEAQTVVEVGIDAMLRTAGPQRLAEINTIKARATQRLDTAAQLLRFQKSLTAQQKEEAADLLRQASALETEAADLLQPLLAAAQDSRQKLLAEVFVEDMLHAGVTVRFANCETTIRMDWQGPLRLSVQLDDGEAQVVLTDISSNHVQVLPGKPWHDAAYDTFLRAIASA